MRLKLTLVKINKKNIINIIKQSQNYNIVRIQIIQIFLYTFNHIEIDDQFAQINKNEGVHVYEDVIRAEDVSVDDCCCC